MFWLFFLVGFASLTGQILLLREILTIFHGTEISIGIFFGSWLGGIGIGASVGARLTRTRRRGFHGLFIHGLVGLAFSMPFQIVIVRLVPDFFGAAPAELAPLTGILAAAPVATFLTAFFTGFLFPIGCRCISSADDKIIARLYVMEALGSLAGGILFTFVLVTLLSPLRIASILSLACAAAAMVYGLQQRKLRVLMTGVPVALCTVVILSPFGDSIVDRTIRARWNALHPGLELVDSRPTRYQQVEIARLGNQMSLFGNGKIVSSFPDDHGANRLAGMIMAEKPDAKSILLVGGGIGSFVKTLLGYPIERLDVVEPDPGALAISLDHMPSGEQQALEDPRVLIFIGDGRFYINRIKARTYDVIVAMMPDPVSAFWNRYYTLEFFEAASRALKPRGVLVTDATSSENFWGSDIASYAGSIYHTLKLVFPSVVGTPGDVTMFFASPEKGVVTLDPKELKKRYSSILTDKPMFDPTGFETILPPARSAFVEKELKSSPVLINTDFRPVSSSLAMILWGRLSGSESMGVLNAVRRGGLTVFLIPLLLFGVGRIAFRLRRGPQDSAEGRSQAMLAMAATGAAAMGVQIVLIYSYQSLFGYVFERIGLMAGIFMAGLAVGGFGAGKVLAKIGNKAAATACMLILLALLCLAIWPVLGMIKGLEPWLIESVLFTAVFMSAVITGAVFPLAASRHLELSRRAGESSGWTDAADHFGAALGAMITGTLLVPLLGTRDACIILALVVILPALLIFLEFLFQRVLPPVSARRVFYRPSFPYVKLSWLLAFMVIAAALWRIVIGPPGMIPVVKFDDSILEKVSGSALFQFRNEPFPHYVGTKLGSTAKTFSLSTMPPAGDVRGYSGPINLLVSVSQHGVIQSVKLIQSKETPTYIKSIDEWLMKFRGRFLVKPRELNVDTMTGATITSQAVIDILQKTGAGIAEPILGLPPPSEAQSPHSDCRKELQDPRLWAVVAILIGFVFVFHSRSRRMRLALLITAFLVLGVYLNAPFTTLDAASLVQGAIPAEGTLWRNLLLLAILAIAALWGQAFCGFLCPFGALQEFLSARSLRVRPEPSVERAGRYVKFAILAVVASLFLITNDTVWASFSPLQHFFADRLQQIFLGRLDTWILALSAAVLILSVFYFRFWCRYLCPAGALLALFNKVSLLRKWAPKTVPARCDLGVGFSEDLDCIRCHRCLQDGGNVQETNP
jgi:predicted membrane-bound spermidine synthase/Na+-translocating ferredoxin:NAD+ oxidoreductase RnfG subunit